MQYLKSFVKVDIPEFTKKKRTTNNIVLPLLIELDPCNRYRPPFDKKTFIDDINSTDGELIEYFDQKVKTQYKKYESNSRYITYGFWMGCVGFAVFCHKINFLRRVMGGQKNWKMLSFKLTSLFLPYLFMDQFMEDADDEELNLLYWQTKDRYKRYKMTGDILQLNPSIQIVDSFLPPLPQPQNQ